MKVTKLIVTYFDGSPIQTVDNWEQLDMTNAANIATIEETCVMSLSEVKSRYKFIPSINSLNWDSGKLPQELVGTSFDCDSFAKNNEPKGSMGS